MRTPASYRIVSQTQREDGTVQLIEDEDGGYHLRGVAASGMEVSVSVAVHSDPVVLAEARELFPEYFPFGGVPVDAT